MTYFSQAKIIEIDHYKDIFSRGHQNYTMQKQSPKCILALKKDPLIYEGAEVCEDFGNQHFYYTSTMMNCIYDCEYCYLQGMYNTGNIVIFVNIEDVFQEVERLLAKHPVYLCISYDTDILAFENVIGYGRQWINFAKNHKNLTIELRTKSANFNAIKDIPPQKNVILAWTLSPEKIVKDYENKTPSTMERLLNIKKAMEHGWKVRLCLDPILYIKDWEKIYEEFIDTTFRILPSEEIYDISIGVFRVPKDYLKKMRKQRLNSTLLNYPFETNEGISSYKEELSQKMLSYVYDLIKKHVTENKIYI